MTSDAILDASATIRYPRLETTRLVLQLPEGLDAPARVAAFEQENCDHFGQWDAVIPALMQATFWERQLEGCRAEYQAGTAVYFWLQDRANSDGRLLGYCHLLQIRRGDRLSGRIAYGLDHRYTGQGIMREAVRALVTFAFDVLDLHRIEAEYAPENHASARLLHTIGFAPEGTARGALRIRGTWSDLDRAALLREEFAVNALAKPA